MHWWDSRVGIVKVGAGYISFSLKNSSSYSFDFCSRIFCPYRHATVNDQVRIPHGWLDLGRVGGRNKGKTSSQRLVYNYQKKSSLFLFQGYRGGFDSGRHGLWIRYLKPSLD